MKRIIIAFSLSVLFCIPSFAQVYANKDLPLKIAPPKVEDYPYLLPIWGKKAVQKGFQLPYSAGIGINGFSQDSELIIDNLMVGFNNGPMYNLDEVIRFDKSIASATSINVRPDFWLFPFLNVYGLFVKAKTSTAIDASVWIPDAENNWTQLTTFSTKADFDATGVGFGLTPTVGIGHYWLALDMNWLWTDVSALDKPVTTFVFGPRLGKTLKLKKPGSNMAFWAGAMRVKFSSATTGSLLLTDIFPEGQLDQLQARVDQGLVKVDDTQQQVDAWWNGLSEPEQANPANQAKYETANRALDKAGQLLVGLDGTLSNAENSSVQYSLDKSLKNMWNFLLGAQYQISRHFMLRAEVGFLGSRTQVLGGLQYRFGL
ncbi:MAG: hypothetical protein NTX99_11220 [Candidatus Aminicenantes bacterium]|nr:hypothetical protein [Candidatus Aminicenantes bacterium]